MILSHEDFAAIEASFGPEKAASIINAFEKLEREQKVEVKRDLLMELATRADLAELKADFAELQGTVKADIARLEGKIDRIEGTVKADIARLEGKIDRIEGAVKADIAELRGEVKRLEMLIKILIGLVVIAMSLFSPAGVELIKLIK